MLALYNKFIIEMKLRNRKIVYDKTAMVSDHYDLGVLLCIRLPIHNLDDFTTGSVLRISLVAEKGVDSKMIQTMHLSLMEEYKRYHSVILYDAKQFTQSTVFQLDEPLNLSLKPIQMPLHKQIPRAVMPENLFNTELDRWIRAGCKSGQIIINYGDDKAFQLVVQTHSVETLEDILRSLRFSIVLPSSTLSESEYHRAYAVALKQFLDSKVRLHKQAVNQGIHCITMTEPLNPNFVPFEYHCATEPFIGALRMLEKGAVVILYGEVRLFIYHAGRHITTSWISAKTTVFDIADKLKELHGLEVVNVGFDAQEPCILSSRSTVVMSDILFRENFKMFIINE